MKDEHIIAILESAPFNSLSDSELAAARAHAEVCDDCRHALEAAQISALLVRGRSLAEIEPPPFFQTRVMAALRERRASTESFAPSIRRLWRAAGALVSGMAATVAALAVFTFLAPSNELTQQDLTSAFNAYSAEELILAPGSADDDELSYDQVLTTVYESDEDAER